jgi:hypothetical protein
MQKHALLAQEYVYSNGTKAQSVLIYGMETGSLKNILIRKKI